MDVANTTAQQGTAQQSNTKSNSAEKKKRQRIPKGEKVTVTKKLPLNIRASKYPLNEEMGQATQSGSLAKADVREQERTKLRKMRLSQDRKIMKRRQREKLLQWRMKTTDKKKKKTSDKTTGMQS